MQSVKFSKWGALLALVAAMGATRFGHLGTLWAPPDASWAVFFLAGFYLREDRWVLAVLLCEAIVIDFVAIRVYGVSSYCVTGAYWFIVPGYSMLWLGGAWLRRHVVPQKGRGGCAGCAPGRGRVDSDASQVSQGSSDPLG